MVRTTSSLSEPTQPVPHCTKCGAIEIAGNGVTLTLCGHKTSKEGECATATYCSAACKIAHERVHSRLCGWTMLLCSNYGFGTSPDPFAGAGADHRWSGTNGERSSLRARERKICPSTELIGVPLALRLMPNGSTTIYMSGGALMTIGDLLMTNPDTGYPIPGWTEGLGRHENLEIGRQDGKPLTAETLEVILEFLLAVVQDMSSKSPLRGWLPLRDYFTPAAFQHFWHRYFKEQREKGRDGFDGPFAPL